MSEEKSHAAPMTDARAAGGLFYDEHMGGEAVADLGDDCEAAAEAAHRDWMDSEREAEIDRLLKEKREAAAEIERLRAVLAVDAEFQRVAEAEAAVLRAERDRLREALREIAQSGVYSWAEGKAIESPDGDRHEIAIAAARAALGEDAT